MVDSSSNLHEANINHAFDHHETPPMAQSCLKSFLQEAEEFVVIMHAHADGCHAGEAMIPFLCDTYE